MDLIDEREMWVRFRSPDSIFFPCIRITHKREIYIEY